MSNKLNMAQRETIVKRVIQHRFPESQRRLDIQICDFAELAWRTVFTPADLLAIKKLPPGWLPKTSELRLMLGGSYHIVYYPVAREIPNCKRTTHVFDAHHPLTIAFGDLTNARRALDTAIHEAKLAINTVLLQATTIPKLISIWPEVGPFVHGMSDATPNLPAVQTDQLNVLLNLPVQTLGEMK